MRIQLEVLREEERFDGPGPCWLCNRQFIIGAVAAWAYATTTTIDCGPVCPTCLEEGPEAMQKRLWDEARSSAIIAAENFVLASESVEAPTVDELRRMERLASPGLRVVGNAQS